jgi:hypothetical protein
MVEVAEILPGLEVAVKNRMVDPLFAPGVKETVASALPAMAEMEVGAVGMV